MNELISYFGSFYFALIIFLACIFYLTIKSHDRKKIMESLSDPKDTLAFYNRELHHSKVIFIITFSLFLLFISIYPIFPYLSPGTMETMFYIILDLFGTMLFCYVFILFFSYSRKYVLNFYKIKYEEPSSNLLSIYKLMFVDGNRKIIYGIMLPIQFYFVNIFLTYLILSQGYFQKFIPVQYLLSIFGLTSIPSIFLFAYAELRLQHLGYTHSSRWICTEEEK